MPTPADLVDLVCGPAGNGYDMIAIARVGSHTTGSEPTVTPLFPGGPGEPVQDYTDFQLILERVLLADGGGRPLVLTRPGFPDEHDPDSDPYEKAGDRYLYFLEYVPEFGAYVSGWSEYSRLIVDGDTVMYSLRTPEPVPFAQGTPPAAFVEAVATVIATVYPTPTP